MKRTVLEYLEETAASYPDRYLYRDPERSYTFAETARIARAIGTRIGSLHVPGRPVAVFMEKSASMAAAILGILCGGCCYCPIDTAMPAERIRTILSVLDPAAVVTEQKFSRLAELPETACPVWEFEELCRTPEDPGLLADIREGCRDTDPLYVLFTSGSTGVPKGVTGCHRMIIEHILWLEDAFPYGPEDVLGNQVPFHFVISLHDIFVPLRFGCSTFILPQEYFSYPTRLVGCLNEEHVTSIFWVPSALTVLARLNGFDSQQPRFLRHVFFIGEVMPVRYINYWKQYLPDARYVNMYGSTETLICMFYELKRDFSDEEQLPIGRPCRDVTAVILDEDGKPIRPGDGRRGELCIGGGTLSLGYYKDPAKTEERFFSAGQEIPGAGRSCRTGDVASYDGDGERSYRTGDITPYDGDGERFYRTGDVASYDGDGEILYHGRMDLQIKRMGYRIELGEIEAAAAAIPEISECACVYQESRQTILMLYTSHEKLDPKQISGRLAARLPRYMMPGRYIYLDTMPRNANGKIDRRRLKETYA